MLHKLQLLILLAVAPVFANESINVETLELSSSAQEKLTQINAHINGEEFKKSLEKYQSKAAQIAGVDIPMIEEPDNDQSQISTDTPILFISASVPMPTLRSYAKQISDAGGGAMVLRGLVNGTTELKPTLAFIASIMNVDERCEGKDCKKHKLDVIIDPLLFRQHGVNAVPAFTVYEKKTYQSRCGGNDSFEQAKVVFGDASLKGLALELASIDKRQTVNRFNEKIGN